MKKYLFIAAVAMAAMACSKVDVVDAPDQEVTFQVANYASGAQTKAEVSVLSEFEVFKCRAFMHAEGVDLLGASDSYAVNGTTYQEFFGNTGETIAWNSTDKEWAPSHTYYWPKSQHSFINFFGWYGTTNSAAAGAKTSVTSSPSLSYAYNSTASKYELSLTWDFTSTLGQAGTNLLYSDMAWRYQANDDTPQYGKNGVTEGVPMLFHHALAKLNIKVYADKLTTGTGANKIDWTVNLKNVSIGNIISQGTLSMTTQDPGTATTKGTWTGGWAAKSGTSAAAVTIDNSASGYAVTGAGKANATDLVVATCVVPQDLTGVNLTFDLKIVTTYSEGNTNTEIIPVSIPVSTAFSASWAKNTQYTWYIKVVPSENEVLFDPAIEEDWSVVSPAPEADADDHIIS